MPLTFLPRRVSARLKRAKKDARTIRERGGDPRYFTFLTVLGIKRPVLIKAYKLFLRPLTPDLEVAEEMINGAFRDAIRATKPYDEFIIDAGAYIGTSAVAFAKAFPQSMVIALEPEKNNFAVLRMNVWGYRNIIPINAALGATVGKRTIYNRRTGEWGFTTIEAPLDCPSPLKLSEVEVVTIDWLMKRYSAKGVDLIKLDVEGSEKEILEHSHTWLDKTGVIFAELHDRIVVGCGSTFSLATRGRSNNQSGEKVLSIRSSIAGS